jgi:hypothetical protein
MESLSNRVNQTEAEYQASTEDESRRECKGTKIASPAAKTVHTSHKP